MRCRECGGLIGHLDAFVQVLQLDLETDEPEDGGYVHYRHLLNPDN